MDCELHKQIPKKKGVWTRNANDNLIEQGIQFLMFSLELAVLFAPRHATRFII